MTRRRTPLALLAVLAGLLLLPASGQAISADRLMVREINEYRADHGLRAVRFSRGLSRGSRVYAGRLMARDEFEHADLRTIRGYREVGEVLELHSGTRARVRYALRLWINSPGHRGILLGRSFTHAGAGFSRGTWKGRPTVIWVGRFGRK